MLDYNEFLNEKKVADILQNESKIKIKRLKKRKLHVKLDSFNKHKQVQKNLITFQDVGGGNYYDSFR